MILQRDEHPAGSTPLPANDNEHPLSETDAISQSGMASAIASIAHRRQVDKLGQPYIDHPARVAEAFDAIGQPVEHCAAWLHDVIEDTDITAQDLRDAGILPEIVLVVELLTRRDDTSDEDYYEGIARHPQARAVKLADIADNSASWRVGRLDHETQVRLAQKYRKALLALGEETK